jgi:NAD(P)-dependent dehydrogenase (short-subunit alcohol dehydrogenase family)
MQTNYLGHYLLTHRLLPLLVARGTPSKPSRIINVASEAHYTCPSFEFDNINDIGSLSSYHLQYPISKFLSVVHTMGLAKQLEEKNVVVHAVCPGIAITEFWDKYPAWQKIVVQSLHSYLSIGKTVSEAAANVLLGM